MRARLVAWWLLAVPAAASPHFRPHGRAAAAEHRHLHHPLVGQKPNATAALSAPGFGSRPRCLYRADLKSGTQDIALWVDPASNARALTRGSTERPEQPQVVCSGAPPAACLGLSSKISEEHRGGPPECADLRCPCDDPHPDAAADALAGSVAAELEERCGHDGFAVLLLGLRVESAALPIQLETRCHARVDIMELGDDSPVPAALRSFLGENESAVHIRAPAPDCQDVAAALTASTPRAKYDAVVVDHLARDGTAAAQCHTASFARVLSQSLVPGGVLLQSLGALEPSSSLMIAYEASFGKGRVNRARVLRHNRLRGTETWLLRGVAANASKRGAAANASKEVLAGATATASHQ